MHPNAGLGGQAPLQDPLRLCVLPRRTYRIEEIDCHGLFVLAVGADMDKRFGGLMNDIRFEAEFLEEVV
ncbi:MAG: hypothetical protein JWR15_1824 [Prosthecobacter sp.]|nr:hypothetical protein [Prosthecobacter sp.]